MERTPGEKALPSVVLPRAAAIIERAPLPTVELQGSAHMVVYVNPAFCELLGKSSHQLIGSTFAEIVPGGNRCVAILDNVYLTGDAVTHAQSEDSGQDPTLWLYAMWPTLDANQQPVGVIVQLTKAGHLLESATAINEVLLVSSLRQHELTTEAVNLNAQLEKEIAERKLVEAALHTANHRLLAQASELEQVVAERTRRLQETVGELEGFSYSVAHDLRTPLRGMQGFARILLEEHAGRLDDEARSYLERIASSAARMDSLITDVLNYTRVLRGAAPLAPVDLDQLVRDIISINPDWQPPRVKIEIEGLLPSVLGHDGLLTQCVSNLLSNAVKFVARGVTPHIRIRNEDRPLSPTQAPWPQDNGKIVEGWADAGPPPVVRVWFEDNGIGIASKDRERVFQMFERINPADQFEGTGIGLTIVRKALDRMGGRVGFEGDAGKGSRFWFELKKVPAPSGPVAEAVPTPSPDSL